jgi:hypothetical protein
MLKETTMVNLDDDRLGDIFEAINAAADANEVNTVNATGDTALTIACGNNLAPVVDYLLEKGKANTHVVNRDGQTPLSLAFMYLRPIENPMPAELLKRLEVPTANQNKRCVLWVATHGCCEPFECDETYTQKTKEMIEKETAEGGKFFVVPAGMQITRYALSPGYRYFQEASTFSWRENNLVNAFLNGIDGAGNFDPSKVIENLYQNIEQIKQNVKKFAYLHNDAFDGAKDKQKIQNQLKMLTEMEHFADEATTAFASPTVFGEGTWMYDKLLTSDAQTMLREHHKHFDETQFYANLPSDAHRLRIGLNFILRFSSTFPLFEMPIKLMFPTPNLLLTQRKSATKLSRVLRQLYNDGFKDVTVIDTSCFGFSGIEFLSTTWHAHKKSVDNFKQFTPGNKLGGARCRNRRHRTRKRRVSRRRPPANVRSMRWRRPHRSRRRQHGG